MNEITIMWLRQLKRHFRSKPRLIGSVGQPLLFFLAIGFGFGGMYQAASGGNYLDFLAPGVIAMSVLFTAIFTGIEVIWDRQFGFLKETLVAPVSRVKIMIGKTLGGATVATIQGLIVLLLTLFFGFKPNLSLLVIGLLFIFSIAIFFTSLGITIASKMTDMHGFQLIMNFLIMPIFFFSGALFPIDDLPKVLSFITKINPLSYGVDGLRGSLIGLNSFNIWFDLIIMVTLCLIMASIGTYMFNKIEV